jgi:glycerol transport system permease protein
VAINTVISITVALPAAYAFSRYRFLGDKHVFFWLLTNRMTPPAVFLLPFFQLYTTLGLMDTHIAVALAHLLFNVPLAVWILEGFMSGVPREIDETAYIDGYSFPRFFLTIFLPLIKAGVGVAAFFCFMFSWVELLMARTLTSVNAKPIVATMTRTVSASGHGLGHAGRRGRADHRAGRDRDLVRAHYIAKMGFADGEGLMFDWMAWTLPVAVFFVCIVLMLIGMTVWEIKSPTVCAAASCRWPPRAATGCSSGCCRRGLHQPGLRRPGEQMIGVVLAGDRAVASGSASCCRWRCWR